MNKRTFYCRVLSLALASMVLWSCQSDPEAVEPLNYTMASKTGYQFRPISIEQAKRTALAFLEKQRETPEIPIATEGMIEEVQTIENENSVPILYAVNLTDNKGYLVMSASIVEKPILAYSNIGKFDFATVGDYNGVSDWLYMKYLKIDGLIGAGGDINPKIANQWITTNPVDGIGLSGPDGQFIPYVPPVLIDEWEEEEIHGPWVQTTWNQRLSSSSGSSIIGYNNFVRFNNCSAGVAPAGCVATAMGQIMKYYNHPNIYNISTMPNAVNGSNYLTASANNVAYLMQDIGAHVSMNYSCDGSGANSSNAKNAFVNNYHYSASGVVPMSYTPVVNNLKNSKPVYLDGCSDKVIKTRPIKTGFFRFTIGRTTYQYDRCHAWVADGFQVINYVAVYDNGMQQSYPIVEHMHMNWGWGGAWNGWYDYETWDDINGGNPSTVDFIYSQDMIYNITPN